MLSDKNYLYVTAFFDPLVLNKLNAMKVDSKKAVIMTVILILSINIS